MLPKVKATQQRHSFLHSAVVACTGIFLRFWCDLGVFLVRGRALLQHDPSWNAGKARWSRYLPDGGPRWSPTERDFSQAWRTGIGATRNSGHVPHSRPPQLTLGSSSCRNSPCVDIQATQSHNPNTILSRPHQCSENRPASIRPPHGK